MSGLVAALRTVARRMLADWLILVAAFTTIALATSLLAAGPIYADAVTISALERSLTDAPVDESNVTVNISVFPDDYATADSVVREALDEAFEPIGSETFAQVEAEAFGFADDPQDADIVDLASFQFFESIDEHASLVDGRWPAESGANETAVLNAAATSLGLSVGQEITVVNRRDPNIVVTVEVVGIYEPDDTSDPFWFADELALSGVEQSGSFVTNGPFVVSEQLMLNSFTRSRIDGSWRALPAFENIEVEQVDLLRTNVSRLGSVLEQEFFTAMNGEIESSSPFTITTDLDNILSQVDRSLTVTRASVLALLIQLAILAGYALVLMAGLITDTRRVETTLLRSRGASPAQVLFYASIEAVILIAPAVLIGPYFATALLRILNVVGPLSDIGLTIDPTVSSQAFTLAIIAGALALLTLSIPAWRSAREFKDTKKARRQATRTAGQRFGIDIALLAIAVVAFWQLDAIGDQISARVGGRFGVDPLLVVAPALGLLAGAVLALRVVPLLARGAEWVAASRTSTVSALASWQISRRPVRYARSSLLLMMAIGIGFFAAAYSTTWTRSQLDQSAYEVGADIAVSPNRSITAIGDLHLRAAHESVEGVTSSMPVVRQTGPVTRSNELAQFVLLDSGAAPGIVHLRPDLGPDFDDLMQTLKNARPTMATIQLPGAPEAIGLTFEAIEPLRDPWPAGCDPELPEEEPGSCAEAPPLFLGRVRAVIQDADQRLHRVDLGFIPVNEGPTRLSGDLVFTNPDGTTIAPAYPLELVSIEVRNHLNQEESRPVELLFGGISLLEDGWAHVDEGSAWGEWQIESTTAIGAISNPSIATAGTAAGGELVLEIETGFGLSVAPVYFSMRVIGTDLPETLPIVVSESFLTKNEATVGDELRLSSLGLSAVRAVITGTITAFPTVDPDSFDAIVVDLPTAQMLSYEPELTIRPADEYWMAVDGEEEPAVAQLTAPPIQSFRIESVSEQATTRASDPVALGTIGALTVGFVAAAVFAAVGFAVSATVSARERLVEFGLLRALGLAPRQLARWLFLEQGSLVVVSLALGTLIGVLLTSTILPLITLTQDGSQAFPEVIVEFPWDTVLVLELAVVVVLGVIVTFITVALRRVGLGGLLRMGED